MWMSVHTGTGGVGEHEPRIPGATRQPHATIEKAGHNLQEDAGEHLAEHIARFLMATSPRP